MLPCEESLRLQLRMAFFAQLTAPKQHDVIKALPLLIAGKIKVKEMSELEEDIDKLVATKDVSLNSDNSEDILNSLEIFVGLDICTQLNI